MIDSKATAGALMLLVRRAKALIEADPERDFEELCGELRMYQASLRTCFTLENFDNLIKSGRMRPLVGTLLHSLGIHVIADATPQGAIHVADKARGEVKTFKAMTALMAASKDCSGAEVVDLPLREPRRRGAAEGADPGESAGQECGYPDLPRPDQLLRHGKGSDRGLLMVPGGAGPSCELYGAHHEARPDDCSGRAFSFRGLGERRGHPPGDPVPSRTRQSWP